MYVSRYAPCRDCGEPVDRAAAEPHVCDLERLVDFVLFELGGELDEVAAEVAAYLASPEGLRAAREAERRR
jgi:hypothetical protein